MASSRTAKSKLASRIRQILAREVAAQPAGENEDPIEHLILAVLEGCDTPTSKANEAIAAARRNFVDWNEVRVSSVGEIADCLTCLGDMARQKAASLKSLLNGVCESKRGISLNFLRELTVSQAQAYLASLPGTDERAVGAVLLTCMNSPNLPLDDAGALLCQRLGLLDAGRVTQKSKRELEGIIGKDGLLLFHRFMAEHARNHCAGDIPNCPACIARAECRFALEEYAKAARKPKAAAQRPAAPATPAKKADAPKKGKAKAVVAKPSGKKPTTPLKKKPAAGKRAPKKAT
ncbi:MAG TPA: hypothetical protein PL033_09760 [Candidatus Brocadiia bacterium]|nr:hypothetical protein [Candidatus Brocadiia bacterium]